MLHKVFVIIFVSILYHKVHKQQGMVFKCAEVMLLSCGLHQNYTCGTQGQGIVFVKLKKVSFMGNFRDR